MWRSLKTILLGAAAVGCMRGELLCSSSAPLAAVGETVKLNVYGAQSNAQYSWASTGGTVQGSGAEAEWKLDGVKPGELYTATVTIRNTGGTAEQCSVQVGANFETRGERETGRVLLARGQKEEVGFGLYSYLLLGSPPDDSTRERYLNALTAYLRLSPSIADLSKFLAPMQLNANYLPVITIPTDSAKMTPAWLLENYDYARARALLRILPGNPRLRGPYIISTLKPADPRTGAAGPLFFQDLSAVPPELVVPWYEVFLNHAAQQRFWERKSAEDFTLKLRTLIGVVAKGIPDVKSSLASWVQWVN